jgi:phospholipase/carboxylesterase
MTFRELGDRMVTLYGQGKFEDALHLTEQHMDAFPDQRARTTFWRMCLLSLSGRSAEVMSVFQQGLDSGLWWAEELFADPDLNAVREMPEFKRLVAESQKRQEEARTQIERDQIILLPDAPGRGGYPLLIALHGHKGNKESNLEHLEVTRQKGWMVLSAQSTQPLFPGSYCWDNPEQGLADMGSYYEQITQTYQIDPQRIVIAGFSQGGGMAIHTALSGKINVRGFIAVACWWPDPESLAPQNGDARGLRGYFVIGEKDHTLQTTREIQRILKENQIQFDEEVHADLAHEFPSDFEKSFGAAIDFIFKEHE